MKILLSNKYFTNKKKFLRYIGSFRIPKHFIFIGKVRNSFIK